MHNYGSAVSFVASDVAANNSEIDFSYVAASAIDDSVVAAKDTAIAREILRVDCQRIENSGQLGFDCLWQDCMNLYAIEWQLIKESLLEEKIDWSFWIKWYEAALSGEPLPSNMLEQIALIEPREWEQGPEHVNGLIAKIEAAFRDETPKTPLTQSQLLDQNKSVVESQLQTLAQLVSEEMLRLRGQNNFSEAEGELIAARISVLESILSSIEKMREALLNDTPSTALAVIEEQLPEVLEGAHELAKTEDEPKISVAVAQMGATVSYLVDNKVPPTLATGVAAIEWGIGRPKAIWDNMRKK